MESPFDSFSFSAGSGFGGAKPKRWIVSGMTIQQALESSAATTPTITYSIVTGPAGVYEITNVTTTTTTRNYFVPPFDLAAYGSPGDTINVIMFAYSAAGPTITLTFPQITNTVAPVLSLDSSVVSVSSLGTWSQAPDSYIYERSYDAGTTWQSWDGQPISLLLGTSFLAHIAALKYGYSTSSFVNTNSVTYSASAIDIVSTPSAVLTGANASLSTHGTYSSGGSPLTPTSYTYEKNVNGAGWTSWDGTTAQTLTNGQTFQFREVAIKSGYTSSSVNTSNTLTYVASTLIEDTLSGWLLTDTYTELNASGKYTRASDAGTASVTFVSSASAGAISGKRMNVDNSSAGQRYQLKANDTITPLASAGWNSLQIRGRVRVPGTRDKVAVGWGSRSVFYGFFLSRNASADDGRVALLSGQNINTHTSGTAILTNQATSSDIEFLLDVPDRLTMRLRAWSAGGTEPGTWGATYTFGSNIDIQSGLLLGGYVDNSGDSGIQLYGWRLVIDGTAGSF